MTRSIFLTIVFVALATSFYCPADLFKKIHQNIQREMSEFEKGSDTGPVAEKQKEPFDTGDFESSFSRVLEKIRKRTKKLDICIKKMFNRLHQDGFFRTDLMIDEIDRAFEKLGKYKDSFYDHVDKADQLISL